jgi:hypothetical protein
MALYKSVDGVRIEMSAQEEADTRAAWAAKAAAKDAALTYELNGVQFRELIFDASRENDVKGLIAGLGPAAKTKARAYVEGSTVFKWSDNNIQWLAANLAEGAAAWEAAWIAKGQSASSVLN